MKKELKHATLQQSITLKRLGLDQKSTEFMWEKMKEPVTAGCSTQRLMASVDSGHPISRSVVEETFAAPDLSELGVALGMNVAFINKADEGFITSIKKDDFNHPAIMEGNRFFNLTSDMSEAESRAGMLIDMLQTKVLDINDVNLRLCQQKD